MTAAIEIRGLTKTYGSTVGIEDLDLTVRAGEVFGFLGPNGAGKTTTIRLLLDLIRPDSGEIRLLGRDARDPRARLRVGYLPGELVLDPMMTGHATLDLIAALGPGGAPPGTGRRRRELSERLGLNPADLERRVRGYSRGMKQKLALVSAFEHEPDLLILDEPTTGLDPLVRETVFEIMLEAGRAGRTVFHSSHVLSEVDRTCSRVAVVREGRLVALLTSEDVRRSVARRMVVRFRGEPPTAALEGLKGVAVVERAGQRVVLRVSGPLDPLLRVLAAHGVLDLAFPEPGLEEAFAALYRDAGESRS